MGKVYKVTVELYITDEYEEKLGTARGLAAGCMDEGHAPETNEEMLAMTLRDRATDAINGELKQLKWVEDWKRRHPETKLTKW